MAIIPSTFKLDWYDPSQPGGVTSALNDNANTATSNATQYTMEDIINTVSYTGGSIDGSGAQYALPVFTDTNTITNLPLGVAGEMLTSGGPGVDPAWAAAPATGPYEVGAGTDSAKLVGDGTNTVTGDCSVVSGGRNNTVSACQSSVAGGTGNQLSGTSGGKDVYGAFIGGGEDNALHGDTSVITGGGKNTLGDPLDPGAASGSFMGSGKDNYLNHGLSAIIGGGKNQIEGQNKDGMNFIGTGSENTIDCTFIASSITSGGANKLSDETGSGKSLASINSGVESSICVPVTAVNTNGFWGATIAGGSKNTIQDWDNTLHGGMNTAGFIGGGQDNMICGIEQSGFIGGGQSNQLRGDGPLGDYSFIGGGDQNCIDQGTCSSILGGGNNVVSCLNAHVIGSGITATRNDAAFVQGLTIAPDLTGIPIAADNAAALLLVPVGSLYRSGGDPDVVSIVH